MKPTIKDIAEYCHVSEGTVDRAIHNRFGIKEETRERIMDAVRELNYIPDSVGQSLATGSSKSIGIVCFDLYNNFFPELIDTIESRAKEHGYFINLVLTHRNLQAEMEGLTYLRGRNVDGIILFPIGTGEEYVQMLKKLETPIVTVYNKIPGENKLVGVNDVEAMKSAAAYIVSKNYDQILYVTPSIVRQEKEGLNTYLLRQRLKGFHAGVKESGFKKYRVFQSGLGGDQFDKLYEAIKQEPGRSAILCECDSYALKVIKLLEGRQLVPKRDYGIMGYDNLKMLDYIHPRLTTIQYSVPKMGNIAFDMLFDTIQGKKTKKIQLLPHEIVEGETI